MSSRSQNNPEVTTDSNDEFSPENTSLTGQHWGDDNIISSNKASLIINKNYGSISKEKSLNEDKNKFGGIFSLLHNKESEISIATEKSTAGSSAPIHALFNLCKVFVGIGILTGPYAMSHCGIILGIFGVTFAGLMSLYSINIQAQTRHKLENMVNIHFQNQMRNQEGGNFENHYIDDSMMSQIEPIEIKINNYSELGRAAFGKKGYIFVSICLFLQQMWSVTAYFSFIKNYIPITFALSIVIPFWLFWNIKKISYLSLFSLSAITSALMLVLYHSVEHIDAVPKTDLKYFDIMNFPYFFGVSIFIFEGNCASLQIEASMKDPKKFKSISVIGILFVIILNCIVSALAYTSYVETIKDVVLFNLPPNIISTFIRISYSLGLIFSIPIQISPMVDIMYRSQFLDDYIKPFRETPKIKYYISVLIILISWVLFALFIPCLQMFINFSGSLVGIFTLSIIPTLCYNKAFKDEISWKRWSIHLGMMVIMSIAGWLSLYYSYLFIKNGKE